MADESSPPNQYEWKVNHTLEQNLFPSKDALVNAAQAWAAENSFFLSKVSSDKERVVLKCVKRGEYRRCNKRHCVNQRQSSTIKTNCPFLVKGRKQSSGEWKFILTNNVHNHLPMDNNIGHPQGRRLDKTQIDAIIQLNESLVRPNQIVAMAGVKGKSKLRDIYNIIATDKRKKLDGRTPIQYLMEHLLTTNCFSRPMYETSGHLKHLFFAFPESIKMTKRFSGVIIADSTYKTNKFKLPLLHFVGITSIGSSFSSAYCFLNAENEEAYKWALESFQLCFSLDQVPVFVTDNESALINAIYTTYPNAEHLLCIWHINKNITKNCKKCFEKGEDFEQFMKDWNIVLNSSDEALFELNLKKLTMDYEKFQTAVNYIISNMYPIKEKIIRCWTNNIKHFGTSVSSRVDGQHYAAIKRYLVSSTGDLLECFRAIKLAREIQFSEYQIAVATEKEKNHHRFGAKFSRVKQKVSSYALDLVLSQLKLPHPRPNCTGHFSSIYGLPCSHIAESVEKFDITHFSPQWLLDDTILTVPVNRFEAEITRINNIAAFGNNSATAIASQLEYIGDYSMALNPLVSSHRGRPVGAHNNSTTRDLSGFEHVEGTAGRRRCGKCNGVGHNSRACTFVPASS